MKKKQLDLIRLLINRYGKFFGKRTLTPKKFEEMYKQLEIEEQKRINKRIKDLEKNQSSS